MSMFSKHLWEAMALLALPGYAYDPVDPYGPWCSALTARPLVGPAIKNSVTSL